MSAKEFVDALQNGKNLDAEDAVKMAMSSKVGDALENKRREVAGSLVSNHIPEVEEDEAVNSFYTSLPEKDEHKKSKEYKKLSPKMKDAVHDIFTKMDTKPSDFLNTFEKTIKQVSKKYKVPERQLMGYFEKEMLTI